LPEKANNPKNCVMRSGGASRAKRLRLEACAGAATSARPIANSRKTCSPLEGVPLPVRPARKLEPGRERGFCRLATTSCANKQDNQRHDDHRLGADTVVKSSPREGHLWHRPTPE
jgi:hypothetical protein